MKLKPILIATTEDSRIWSSRTKALYLNHTSSSNPNNEIRYQIYLIDPTVSIKEGDYYIAFNVVKRAEKVESQLPYHECYKIICSTDNLALEPYQGHFEGLDCTKYMPKLSDEAIESLIEYYNSNGKLPDEVEVYESILDCVASHDGDTQYTILNQEGNVDITIFQEKNYTKEEVIKLIKTAFNDFRQKRPKELVPGHVHGKKKSYIVGDVNEWITDNLK